MTPKKPEEAYVAGVRLTNPERVLYPEQGLTKRQLALYYEQIAVSILPHVVERPLSLVRCPSGRQKFCFYQRNFSETLPDEVHSIQLKEKDEQEATYILIRDLAGLIALVQVGVLEIHPWGSRSDNLERPDRLTFDLDPDPDVPWQDVVRAAQQVGQRLIELGLQSFVKTSGSKGLHVVVPLVRRSTWDEASEFAQALAEDIVRREPERYVAKASKAARKGKIFVDYLRNTRSSTSVAAYSSRARPGAPVSAPLHWEELDSLPNATVYTVQNLSQRLDNLSKDPWAGFFELRQSVTRKMWQALE